MATETEFHHQNPRSVSASVSEMLDHGSISFGRFAVESLEWEKWSVFSHNRCQEELEKFKAPGIVAQKKAFFEEYYKKLRAMKKLEAEHQDDLKSQVTQVDAGNNAALLKEVNKFSYISPIQTLENDARAESDASAESIEKEQETDTKEVFSNLSSKNPTSEPLCASESDQSAKYTPKTRNSGIAQPSEIVISNSVKRDANKSKNQGNVASTRNMTKMGSTSKKDGAKSSEKMKPSPHDKNAIKADNRNSVLGKSSTYSAANGSNSNHVSSHRKTTESCTGSAVQISSMARNRLVPSSPSGNNREIKTKSNHRDLTDKFRRCDLQSSQSSLKETGSRGSERKLTDRIKNPSLRNTLNLKSGVGFTQMSRDRERKQLGKDKSDTKLVRVSKSATITSNDQKNVKPVHQDTNGQPTNLTRTRKVEARPKTASWR